MPLFLSVVVEVGHVLLQGFHISRELQSDCPVIKNIAVCGIEIMGALQNPGGIADGEIRQHQYGPFPAKPWRTLHPLELPLGNDPELLPAGRDETSHLHRPPAPVASAADPGDLFLRPAQPHQLRRASAGYEPGQPGLRQATETFPPEADRKRRKHGNPLGQIPLSQWPKTPQEWEWLQQAAALAPPPALPREEEQ